MQFLQQPGRFEVINAEEWLWDKQPEQRQPGDAVDLGWAAAGGTGKRNNCKFTKEFFFAGI